ncbi:MAG: hypothetical protein A2516_00325 [Alphaproteobacteria bacterium RIFOXYD12_FULL_60_8]|nr:MAG: hypothetical protein A2516_00325 [Alphaproteobacteria bacterium RIFOXYD12_FULL_60_8]
MSDQPKPPFYASGRKIFKRPIETKHANGTSSFTWGCLVCEVSEWIPGAEAVVDLLNAGVKAQQLEVARAALKLKDDGVVT